MRCRACPPSGQRTTRRGFVLLFILLSLVVMAAMTAITSLSSWGAMRSARLAWNGERALLGAEEASAIEVSQWQSERFSTLPVGALWRRTISTRTGGVVSLQGIRTGALSAVIEATMTSKSGASLDTASRRVRRALALSPPAFPIHAALTALAPMSVDGGEIDGSDYIVASEGCDAQRDTLAVAGVLGAEASISAATRIVGTTPVISTNVNSVLATDLRAQFDSAWATSVERVERVTALAPRANMPAFGSWSYLALAPADSTSTSLVEVTAAGRHEGLIVVYGDLRLSGALRLDGLLIVNGAIDAGSGAFEINGAVLVRDPRMLSSTIGSFSSIRYSRCAVQRALATIARPSSVPFALWVPR